MDFKLGFVLLAACLVACREAPRPASGPPSLAAPTEAAAKDWDPQFYTCLRTSGAIEVDGILDEAEWGHAPYTSAFIDIEGSLRPKPRFLTRAKLLWDDRMLYVAVEMEDPHLWASLTERDSVVWHENDFEIFLDPDGDNHHYFELEVSPRGTLFDLFLVKPYRDGHAVVHEWDVRGLQVGIQLDGSLNDPSDVDGGWTLELAIPWAPLMANRHRMETPDAGERWRMNMSRVAWRHTLEGNRYVKVTEPLEHSGRPEDNWVWSPQGEVAMHVPEMWGILELSEESRIDPQHVPALTARERAGWALMSVYHAQRAFREEHRRYAATWEELGPSSSITAPAGWSWPPQLTGSARQYEALSQGPDSALAVDHEGRLVHYSRENDGELKKRN